MYLHFIFLALVNSSLLKCYKVYKVRVFFINKVIFVALGLILLLLLEL